MDYGLRLPGNVMTIHHVIKYIGKRWSSLWVVCILAAGASILHLAGCNTKKIMVAVVPRTSGTMLWEPEHTGVERGVWSQDVYVYWNAPMREDDVQGQIDILTRAVDRGAKGLIVSPVEALPLRTPVYSVLQRGIPVVVIGTDLDLAAGKNLAYVLSDEDRGGQLAARRVGSLLKGRGTVAILGISNQLTGTTQRARSLEKTLAEEFPGIHVTFRSFALPTVSQEQQVTERLLAKSSQVDAILALTEASTRGAYYALTDFDKISGTRLIGFDQDLLVPIHNGGIDSVIMQNTYQMGRVAMKLMDEEMHGGASRSYVMVQPQLVTRENIDSAQTQEMLDLSWFNK
ncbi:MAG: substrate-binding domain-containing protein [Terracidiphilus sp.]|jgi:ribose transport system substrate-binding protein